MFLVTGATGNVGSALVEALVAAEAPVRALVRRADARVPDGVEVAVGDLNSAESVDFTGVQGVFLMPGYAGMEGMLAQAREAGVQHVVLMSSASAALADMNNAVSRYMTLSEQAVRDAGMDWTFLRPRAFMSNALRWLPQLSAGGTIRAPFPDVRAACVDPRDIAAVAMHALTEDGHDNRIYDLTGPESLLPADQVAVLSRVLGRDLKFVGMSNEEARADMEANMPVEYVDAFFNFYVEGTLDEAEVHPDVQNVTGRPPRTFEQWATVTLG